MVERFESFDVEKEHMLHFGLQIPSHRTNALCFLFIDKEYIYVIGSNHLSDDLHDINELANKEFTNLKLDYKYNAKDHPKRFYYRSDHYNFAKNNIPVIFYFTGVHEDYHKPGDDAEKIMYSKMAEIGKLVFHTVWNLANMADRIEVDRVNDFSSDR